MLNVLINAYAIAPNWGSEQGMGWNWVINIAKFCNVFVITEGEWKNEIEEAIKYLPQRDQLHIYYNPVSPRIRKMCWNQGDWRFYFYYHIWQYKTLKIARTICSAKKIDIVHQLNMVGFREPGQLWRMRDIPYVLGPISGMLGINLNYLNTNKSKFFYAIKNIINFSQFHFSLNFRNSINHASYVITPLREESELLKRFFNKETIIISETGIDSKCIPIQEYNKKSSTLDIFWCGRFVERKKLDIALKTFSKLCDLSDIKLHIAGFGMRNEDDYYKRLANKLHIENRCEWYGKIDNVKVKELMSKMDLLFFTSIHDVTSTVVMEAIQNRLPILCHDVMGFGAIVDETIGWKIPLISEEKSINGFADIIRHIYFHREEILSKKPNFDLIAESLTYDSKARHTFDIYNQCISK